MRAGHVEGLALGGVGVFGQALRGKAGVEHVEACFKDWQGVDLAAIVQRHDHVLDESKVLAGPFHIQALDVKLALKVEAAAHVVCRGGHQFICACDARALQRRHVLLNELGRAGDALTQREHEPIQLGLPHHHRHAVGDVATGKAKELVDAFTHRALDLDAAAIGRRDLQSGGHLATNGWQEHAGRGAQSFQLRVAGPGREGRQAGGIGAAVPLSFHRLLLGHGDLRLAETVEH